MNVEQMINHIKLRLGMYIGEISLGNLEEFIRGFNFNNAITHRTEAIDVFFRTEFQQWVDEWIFKNYGIKDMEFPCWSSRIMKVVNDENEALEIFFQIVEEFFKEFHSRELK